LTKTLKLSSPLRVASGALLLGAYALIGCGADGPADPGSGSTAGSANMPSGGSAQSAGSSGAAGSGAGTNASAGRGGSGSGQAGQGSSQAGSVGVGGNATGGNATGGMSSAGGMSGGSATTGGSGAGGSTGGKPPADPSMGCNKANPATGTSSAPLKVSGHDYYVKLPTNYDASKPYPVMMMFNPTGNPISWAEQNAGFEKTGPKEAWIRVYPTMAVNANGWGANDVAFFEPFYEQVLSSFCVDKARVFAGGESSGGDFVSILGCEHGDKVRAVAPCATKPVNGYDLDLTKRQCKGQVTAIVIHGKNDNQVGPANGPKTRDFYVGLNKCAMDPMPTPVQGYTDTMSNCVMYQGCAADHPVYWCLHTDPNYNNTNHGWPGFAPKFLWELLSTY
jgi:poly(3-hydroxybutyrate) depolymerase